ncbi:MAG: hypothetical protein ACRDFC_07615, partial [Ignavibacteria bacterium]
LISITFCYLYYHKFIVNADFYSPDSSGGIYAVLNFEALKPIQYRVLIPFIFKALSVIKLISDKALFFLMTIALTYFILLSFYFLLNKYFLSKAHNYWLSPVIIYPMIWNYIILNGQFFYMDFSVLLIIILGMYFIVSGKYNLLLLTFFLGTLNHPSVGYLLIAFLLFNYRRLLNKKTIIYGASMVVIYLAVYGIMNMVFTSRSGYFVIFNLPRNLSLFSILPEHIILRDLIFNFGGLHIFLLIFFVTGLWKGFRSPLLYINLTIIPYFLSVLISFSIEEIRNYIAIIPFIIIPSLIYLSTFENSFLKTVEDLKPKPLSK